MKMKRYEALLERIALAGMEDLFGEVWCQPKRVPWKGRAGQKRKSEANFFLAMYWSRWKLNDDTWHLVKRKTPRVASLYRW